MAPCVEASIPLYVRNILNPAFAGTLIAATAGSGGSSVEDDALPTVVTKVTLTPPSAVKVVTSTDDVSVVAIKAGSWASVTKVARRAMAALDDAGIKVVGVASVRSCCCCCCYCCDNGS
jgi:aspartokinase